MLSGSSLRMLPRIQPALRCLLGVVLATSPAAAQTLTDKARRDEVVMAPRDDAMTDAVRRARKTLPEFFEAMAHPEPGMSAFSVKVEMAVPSGSEYIWLRPVRLEGGNVVGVVSNTPARTQAVERGQTIAFPLSAVADWTYQRSGRMMGNYTACALASRFSPREAAEFQRTYRIDCTK